MITKVTYIVSNIDKAVSFEWIVNSINNKIELSGIILNKTEPYLYKWLQKKNIECHYISHLGKKSYLTSLLKTIKILRKIKPNTVHTHLFDANLIGLSAAKILNIKNRVYTRHHSTYHHEYFPKAVKYDLLANRMATKIVAISKNVERVLTTKENVNSNKVALIHHGFNINDFKTVSMKDVIQLKSKYNIHSEPVIGVVARYTKLKGIEYIITAFKHILTEYPKATLVLANANGVDREYIQSYLKDLPQDNYKEIAFEPNLFALYQLFNIYIHTPINKEIEAFGQTYIEALAARIPSIFTLSGVASEFINHRQNALVVPYKNSSEIKKNILELLKNEKLRNQLIDNGYNSITAFHLNTFINKLELLYLSQNK